MRLAGLPACSILRELRASAGRPAVVSSRPAGPYATCPRCGAPAAPAQEYCLECGLRLPQAPGSRGRASRPWRAGTAAWSVLALLLLAGVGTLAAVVATRDGTAQTLTATSPPARGVPTSSLPTPPTTTTPAPPEPTTPPATTAAPERPINWPDRDGHTIVLESIPTSASRQQALETARRALRAGLHDVGVLASSNYASLQPGYYVVFAGIYDTSSEAIAALDGATEAGFKAYVRTVSR